MREEDIARERIDILFEQADEEFGEHPDRADRYVELARRIAMKYTISLPRRYRMRFCSDCGSYLVPGSNCRVRLNARHKTKTITCLKCKNVARFPYRDRSEQ